MKRLGLIAAWLIATSLATLATVAAVRLVGATVADQPSPTTALAHPAPSTTVIGEQLPVPAAEAAAGATDQTNTVPTTAVVPVPSGAPEVTATTGPAPTQPTMTSTISDEGGASTTTTSVATTTTTTAPPSTTTSPTSSTTTTVAASTGPFVYDSSGGSVTVSCTGDEVSLNGAIPSTGYTAEVDDSGPDRVRVEFTDDDDNESEIRVECSDGVPDPEIIES